MSAPTLYIKNALRIAENGLGDGTIYATGSSATIDATQKTVALSGLSIITDIGVDADDKFNGHILYFPSSGNKYHIVDWVASTDTATTWETPQTGDIGASEIRKNLTQKAGAANPFFLAQDGQLYSKFKAPAAGDGVNATIALPNFLGQGGFEELAVAAFTTSEGAINTWWAASAFDWDIVSASALLGSRMAVWTVGVGDAHILQRTNRKFLKGRTYKFRCKIQSVGGNTDADCLYLYARSADLGAAGALDSDWDTTEAFKMQATTTATWVTSPDFVPEFDCDNTKFTLSALQSAAGAATSVRIDELYFWEVVDVQSLVIFDHNLASLASTGLRVFGYNCDKGRTSVTAADYNQALSADVSGLNPALETFSSQIYPVYTVEFIAVTAVKFEAAQILLGEKWVWDHDIEIPVNYKTRTYDEAVHKSRSGVKKFTRYSKAREIESVYRYMSAAHKAVLLDDWLPHHLNGDDGRHPFAILLTDDSSPILVRYIGNEFFIEIDGTVFSSWPFKFEEVL